MPYLAVIVATSGGRLLTAAVSPTTAEFKGPHLSRSRHFMINSRSDSEECISIRENVTVCFVLPSSGNTANPEGGT